MTWGEFKKLVDETEGVTDETKINYIEVDDNYLQKSIDVNVSEGWLSVF